MEQVTDDNIRITVQGRHSDNKNEHSKNKKEQPYLSSLM